MKQTKTYKILTVVLAILILAFAITTAYAVALSLTQYSPTADNTETTQQQVIYNVEKSLDQSGWNTVGASGTIENWFCRITTTQTGYTGNAQIVWQLQKSTDQGTTWSDIIGASVSTTCTFTGETGQNIYATSNGAVSGNLNWATYFTETAQYRVSVNPQTA